MEQTRQQETANDSVTAMFQNHLEKINIDLKNTENDSLNIWTKSLKDLRVFGTKEIDNHCLNSCALVRKNPKNTIIS